MNLRNRTILFFIGITIALLTILYIFSRSIMLESFEKLEEKIALEDLKRAYNFLELERTDLDRVATNLANDDAPLTHFNYQDNRINVLLLIDSKGKVVFGEGYNLFNHFRVPVPRGFEDIVASSKTNLLAYTDPQGGKVATILLPRGPMLVVARPLTMKTARGSGSGTLVIGRYIDSQKMEDLSDAIRLPMQVLPVSNVKLSPFQMKVDPNYLEVPYSLERIGNTINGYALLQDIYGKPSFVLRVSQSRDVFVQGEKSILYFTFFLIFAGLIYGLIIVMQLDKAVLSRISRLNENIENIRSSRNLSSRVVVNGKDELSTLMTEFNLMLHVIEETQEQIKHQAYHDSLTKLPNRALFHKHLEQALVHAEQENQRLALLFIDLDRFKLINDTLGHDFGDGLLQIASRRLQEQMGSYRGSIYRLGGDEFTVILPSFSSKQELSDIVFRVIQELGKPFRLQEHELIITASIGISIYPENTKEVEALIRQADIAMYAAKEAGRNHYRFYSTDMERSFSNKVLYEKHLRKAIEHNELKLHYQPQINTKTGEIYGMEALLRWYNPQLGNVSPAEFIPLAEESGLIISISEWVLSQACQTLNRWQYQDFPPVQLSINISAIEFHQSDFVDKIKRAISNSGIDARYLELEITESFAVRQEEETTIQKLQELKELGLRIAIDDFGTGYSSLHYLQRLRVDTLKIDQSFVREITGITPKAPIALAIIAMANSLGMDVTAEGVETENQLLFLHRENCHQMQGYLFSKPLPIEEAEQLLLARKSYLTFLAT